MLDRQKSMTIVNQLSKSEVLAHLLKQQTLQLVWSLAVDGVSSGSALEWGFNVKDFGQALAAFLLTTLEQEGATEPLPPLVFLQSASSALAWRWIHCLDFCLLYHFRIHGLSG